MKFRNRSLWFIGLSALLAFTGCDDDESGKDKDKETETDAGPKKTSVYSVVSDASDFTILKALIDELPELKAKLENADATYTVFAPNDQAFTDSGFADAAAFTAKFGADAEMALEYHLLDVKVEAANVTDDPRPVTVAGYTLFVGTDDTDTTKVLLNGGSTADGANVTATNTEAGESVIHTIDRVITPRNVVQAVGLIDNLSMLTAAAGEVTEDKDDNGTVTTIQPIIEALGQEDITLFGPTNTALTTYLDSEGLLADGEIKESLTPVEIEALKSALQYHVTAAGALDAAAVTGSAGVVPTLRTDTLGGKDVTMSLFHGPAGLNGGMVGLGADVVTSDIKATNGVLHIVDEVLEPLNAADALEVYAKDGGNTSDLFELILAVAESDSENTLLAALKSDTAELTVFAPQNGSAGLPDDTGLTDATNTDEKKNNLRQTVLLHAAKIVARAEDVTTEGVAADASDTDSTKLLVQKSNVTPAVVTVGVSNATEDGFEVNSTSATVTMADIGVSNGVIHIIDAVITPANQG